MKPWHFLLLSLVAGGCTAGSERPGPAAQVSTVPMAACRACHAAIVDRYLGTAHANTSAPGTAASIKGSFDSPHNVLKTGRPSVSFRMEQRDQGFYQTAVDTDLPRSRTERIDLVIGSGRKGQSYLYWRQHLLLQLPVSYLTGLNQWINSPGYRDGEIDFTRVIPPRCLECHSTSFGLERDARGALRYAAQYTLGITCEKCHGSAARHLDYQTSRPDDKTPKFILNPAKFTRERQLDNCALCHSGPRRLRQPPFAYRPGAPLDSFLVAQTGNENPNPDVHGDQIGLLQRTKCFRASPAMTCSTCHDVHTQERDLVAMAQKCLSCHQTTRHSNQAAIGTRMLTQCVNCHLPDQPSSALRINTPKGHFAPSYRSHAIAIYPAVAAAIRRRPASK